MRKHKFIRSVLDFINFESELDDFDNIHETIEKELVFRGTNIWILMFAIIIASVGLNMNSTAVIIGAMLISPLMGPINGMGYSIATYNFPMFRRALKNFTFAVIASLVASTAYFAISPISIAHSELLARTSPTIYDVFIALFGGLAGIVGISRKLKGNVIPGVAIATALMPPLCTAGYGIATGQTYYFLGAIYLFTINAVFIGISSVIFSQIQKFPIRSEISRERKKIINRWISLVIILVLIPSIYFGYNLVQKEQFNENASKYVNSISVVDGNFLLSSRIDVATRTITLVYGSDSLNNDLKKMIKDKAEDFSLKNIHIEFKGLSFEQLSKKSTEVDNLKIEISRLNQILYDKDKLLDSVNYNSHFGRKILLEIRTLYPEISHCSYAVSYNYKDTDSVGNKINIVTFQTNENKLSGSDKAKIENWLKVKLGSGNLKVFYETSLNRNFKNKD